MPTLQNLFRSFQKDSTRDLAWALFSPELLANPANPPLRIEPTAKRLQWLYDTDARQLQFPGHHRLGHYYESLWEYFFRHDEQYQLIAHNEAILKNGRTLGELDFVIFDTVKQRYIHLEIAVKFYLFYPHANSKTPGNNSAWIGPDSRDNLEKKWQKLNLEQSLLSRQDECRNRLEQLGIRQAVEPAISMKGYLFRPENSTVMPHLLHAETRLHRYYRCENLPQHAFSSKPAGIIPKTGWLRQCHSKNSLVLSTQEQMIEQVMSCNRPLMACFFNETANSHEETERFFIVPPSWPDRETPHGIA